MTTPFLEALETKLAELATRMLDLAKQDKVATPEFREASAAHRLVKDLIDLEGGTPVQRAEVARRLAEMEGR